MGKNIKQGSSPNGFNQRRKLIVGVIAMVFACVLGIICYRTLSIVEKGINTPVKTGSQDQKIISKSDSAIPTRDETQQLDSLNSKDPRINGNNTYYEDIHFHAVSSYDESLSRPFAIIGTTKYYLKLASDIDDNMYIVTKQNNKVLKKYKIDGVLVSVDNAKLYNNKLYLMGSNGTSGNESYGFQLSVYCLNLGSGKVTEVASGAEAKFEGNVLKVNEAKLLNPEIIDDPSSTYADLKWKDNWVTYKL